MTNAVSKSAQALSGDTLSHALTFLDSQDVARGERTCWAWKRTIGSDKQTIWKAICLREKIFVIDAAQLSKTALKSYKYEDLRFTPPLLKCIAEYAEESSYKEHASFVRANIIFYSQTMYIYDQAPSACVISHYCGGDKETVEPYPCIRLSPALKKGEIPKALSNFPSFVPLRLLMDKEGNYKKEGDELRVVFEGRRAILKCQHRRHFCDGREITSWEESIKERVRISQSVRFMSATSLQTAQTLAKAAPEWTSIEPKEKSTSKKSR